MARKKIVVLEAEKAISLGARYDKKTRKLLSNHKYVEGYYLGFKLTASKKYAGIMDTLHIFKDEKGSTGVWGFAGLNAQLAGVPKGFRAFVTYIKKVDLPNGNEKHIVEVDYDDEDTISVDGLQGANSGASEDQADAGVTEMGESEALEAGIAESEEGLDDSTAEEAIETLEEQSEEEIAPAPRTKGTPQALPPSKVAKAQEMLNKARANQQRTTAAKA